MATKDWFIGQRIKHRLDIWEPGYFHYGTVKYIYEDTCLIKWDSRGEGHIGMKYLIPCNKNE